jgi:peptidoglycan DL-endopeptidase CwlO
MLGRFARLTPFALAAVLAVVLPVRAEPPAIRAKRAEAQQVLARVQQLDAQLERTVETYNLAQVRLTSTQSALRSNGRELVLARQNLHRAQTVLAQRVVYLYTSGAGDQSALEIVLGARSLAGMIDELDAAARIAHEDAQVLGNVRNWKAQVEATQQRLVQRRADQHALVARLASSKASIEGQIGELQRLRSSIRGEIARLQAEERVRQAKLKREALARLAAEQRAAARAAAERARAAAAKPQPAAPTTTATTPVPTTADRAPVTTAPATTTSTATTPPTTTAQAPATTAPTPPHETTTSTPATTTTVPPAAPPPPAPGPGRTDVVAIALRYLGIPYRWAGASPSTGFDCSGLVMYVYAQVGISLPHSSYAQWGMGTPVSRADLEPGDLVFFNGESHVGIYIGGGQFVHAPHTGDVVKISSLDESWYASTFDGGRRL